MTDSPVANVLHAEHLAEPATLARRPVHLHREHLRAGGRGPRGQFSAGRFALYG
jgi:hypothetical protein